MKEVFEKIAVKVDEYGADGDMKKTQFVLDLIGSVTDPNTYKCILVAGEQGMEMNCYSLENLSSIGILKNSLINPVDLPSSKVLIMEVI